MKAKLFLGPLHGKVIDYSLAYPQIKIKIKRKQAKHIWIPGDLDQLVVTYAKTCEVNGVMYFSFVGFDHDPAPNPKVI
jgi:hypothetical protein